MRQIKTFLKPLPISFKHLTYFDQNRFNSSEVCSLKESIDHCDLAVVGGGIIGTSVARKIKQTHSDLKVVLLEKECSLAKHQSSHNSGVVHSGIYYKPGSLKAKFCTEGADLLQNYCTAKNVPCQKVGKIILALDDDEVKHLCTLNERGIENGVKNIELLSSHSEIRKVCSSCCGVQALWIPNVYIVDFKVITNSLGKEFMLSDGKVIFNFDVNGIVASGDCEYPILISSTDQSIKTKYLILSGGLQTERLTKLAYKEKFENSKQKFMTVRAEYIILDAEHGQCINTNVYKVPNLDLPFLNAHLSPRLNNEVLLGPWVVPSLTTDSYACSDVNLGYVKNLATSRAFHNMVFRNLCDCVNQVQKDLCTDLRVKELQAMVPDLPYQHLKKSPVALQNQFLNSDGSFVDDYVFEFFEGEGIQSRTINLKFTPSPAATSCLSIADYVAKKFADKIRN